MLRSCSLFLVALAPAASGCFHFRGATAYEPTTPLVMQADDRTEMPSGVAAARFASFTPRSSLDDSSLAQTSQAPTYRDPQKAFRMALAFPGGGHFYTGETKKGAVLLGIAAGALVGGAMLSSSGCDDPYDCEYDFETHECEPESDRTPLFVGAGIAAASWIYGVIDSRQSAARANARNGAAVTMAPMLTLRKGKPMAGVQLRMIW
ncbi:MAG TPA: hypothetical protein VF178_10885 [Gemmatimonadaceae bacterium]